jgi:hypothetical protein
LAEDKVFAVDFSSFCSEGMNIFLFRFQAYQKDAFGHGGGLAALSDHVYPVLFVSVCDLNHIAMKLT